MNTEEIIDMARQAGGIDMTNNLAGGITTWLGTGTPEFLERFAKLVDAKATAREREKWKEIVDDQRLRLQALNEIIGGEDSTTTGNILSYSRWEMSLEDAIKDEREACAKLCDWMQEKAEFHGTDCCKFPTPTDCAYAIRNRGNL